VKEAHTRVGEGDVRYVPGGGGHGTALPSGDAHQKTHVDHTKQVPVTKFLK
jgi:hypothetical protein